MMHRFPSRDTRNKPKPPVSPIDSTRTRSLSALSVLQPSHIHTRASTGVRRVFGARSLKEPALFVDTIGSWDKPKSSADSITTRPRRNTSPTELTCPKDIAIPSPDRETVCDESNSACRPDIPVGSLLFSPTSNTPLFGDQPDMQQFRSSFEQSGKSKDSPEPCDSGYASGQSAVGITMPNVSPAAPRTPLSLGRLNGPLTPGGMNMRLSPTIPRSMMPMPILNLPPLPPTPTPDHTHFSTRSLQPEEIRHVKKSMPALMRHGTSNLAETHAEDDEGEDDSSEDSDSSDTEEAVPTEGDSSPEPRDSTDDNIEGSAEQGGSEDYFNARDTHTPVPLESPSTQPSGLVTPRASEQTRVLSPEASAPGLQSTPASIPPTTGSSPWTLVDATPGADRGVNGHASRSDYFSHPAAAARQAFKTVHRTPKVLSLASPSGASSTLPRSTPNQLSPSGTIAARRARAATVFHESNGEPPRPALYQQTSQSMMNLSSPPIAEGLTLTGLDTVRSPLRAPWEGKPNIATPGTPGIPAPTPLMRRNSMPTMILHPPSYADLFTAAPREEEGREKLPPYSCGIHIEGMMPRKMEFTAPGVLAKDRSWKKQYIVLHGTSLLIYKNDIRKFPIGGKVKGKEKYEGVVTEDEVDLSSATVHLPGCDSSTSRLNPLARRSSKRGTSAGTSESGTRSSLLSRLHGNSSKSTVVHPQEPGPSNDKGSTSQSTVSGSSSCPQTKRWSHNQASSSFANLPHFNPPFSSGNALIRHYTLQKAECGLGSDYYKRRNVIRVRCEGEQFLLQAENVMQVVDWIECLQAGTNVALDLDERPMTKPPPFPRRRRRRRVRPADGAGVAETNAGAPASGATANAPNNASGR